MSSYPICLGDTIISSYSAPPLLPALPWVPPLPILHLLRTGEDDKRVSLCSVCGRSLARSSWTAPRAAPWTAAAAPAPSNSHSPPIHYFPPRCGCGLIRRRRGASPSPVDRPIDRLQCNAMIASSPFPLSLSLSLSNAPHHPVVGRPSHFAFPSLL